MKKIVTLLLITLMVFSAFGCTKEPPKEQKVDRKIGFSAQYVRTDGYREGEIYPKVVAVRSTAELQAYYEQYKSIYSFGADGTGDLSFVSACKRYNDEYFERQELVIVVVQEPSGSNRHKVRSVTLKSDGELFVHIRTIIPQWGDDDMAQWHILIEPQVDFKVPAVENITACVDGDASIDVDRQVQYTSGYAHMELALPEGWSSEIVEDQGDGRSFGINFWPSNQSEGKIFVSYHNGIFALCGTGLETKDIRINTYSAIQGTYDQKRVWDYIRLLDTIGTYIIYNEGAEAWWPQYGEAAMGILQSLKVGVDETMDREGAIEIAKKACTIEYETVSAFFVYKRGAWEVKFRNPETGAQQLIIVEAGGKLGAFSSVT